ncbi:MAG TPA: UDP-N-acetylmuramoyl-L-alanyl-D-glutamate--2,6-diaminopimelate ligase [Stellaceae bacterium]|nr:UDP-N-acetylmuramoyl-L-alanyl-D-glutamate--2,6-diaminopimelate ligase [Stellaceae bacterium]
MRFTELVGEPPAPPGGDPEIVGLSADSRTIAPGFLFAALAGARLDGRRFAREAVARGAVAILTDDAAALELAEDERRRVAILVDPNPGRRLALLAARFYGRQPRLIAAVTGTNGKTSVAHFTREIWTALGGKAASLGTLGVVTAEGRRPGALTTPDPVALHRELAALAAAGVDRLALEASSHGLQQFRLDGVGIAAAGFTNLTRDHLDYHGDMARYRAAKERLFRDLLGPGGPAVLNADSEEFPRLKGLCRELAHPVLAYGRASGAALRLVACLPRAAGQDLTLDILGERRQVLLPLAGAFQAMNALCALGLAIATGAPPAAATAALAALSGVPGRLQLIATEPQGGAIFVDYAHTPDALATALAALRAHARRRLAVVFGCGGDRDPGKRPLMGKAAAGLADHVVVTDDNPRGEPPAAIRQAILAAAPQAIEIGDRRAAIAAAIGELGPGDLLLIAGKGHETGQIVGDRVYPFDDAVVAREIARSRGWRVVAAEPVSAGSSINV